MEIYPIHSVICPKCHAELDPSAVVCHECGTPATATAESLAKPHTKPQDDDRLLDRPWMITVLLLHVGVLGIPVFWKTKYPQSTRIMIVVASIIYTIVAVGIIVGVGGWLLSVLMGG